MILVALGKDRRVQDGDQHQGPGAGHGQGYYLRRSSTPGPAGEEDDTGEAGEKKMGLDWRLRNAGYCYYSSTIAP